MVKREISKQWKAAGFSHLSASQLLRTPAKWVFDYLYLTPEERSQVGVGERAAVGTSVHNAVQAIVCHGADMIETIEAAQIAFDFHNADEDDILRVKFRECIPAMIENGVNICVENGFIGAIDEERIECWLNNVDIPVIGFVDLLVQDSMFGEMKTKAPRKTKLLKDGSQGWAKATIPKSPEFAHVCQAAIYWHALRVTPSIIYIAEHDAVIFNAYNCPELQADGIAYALNEMRHKALIRQNLLNVSNNPKVLASIIDPDWGHMYQWKMKDEWLERAKDLWKI
jgi:hypothetical protein